MKKLFTITAVCLSLAANATAQTRKTWDLTKGFSATSMYYLQQDAAAGTNWVDKKTEKNPVYFESKARKAGPLTATVNGNAVTIHETEGLVFNATGAAHLNIYSNAEGQCCIWLNGKKAQDQLVIPKVPAGEKITIDYETHKANEARGFKSITDGFVDAADGGKKQWTTKTRDTAVVVNNSGSDADYTIQATSGFHIYSIVIGQGDDPNDSKEKVGYVYSGELSADLAYALLSADDELLVTPLDASTTLTREQLQGFDLNVLSSTIPADNANVGLLKEVQPFVPTLNLNARLYNAWGYGEAVPTEQVAGVTGKPGLPLFNGLDLIDGSDAGLGENEKALAFSTEAPITGVRLGAYYAGDDTLATVLGQPDVVAIHQHNISHNGYLYLPLSAEVLASGYNAGALLDNAISMLTASKAAITATTLPAFSVHYAQQQATVTIGTAEPYAQIYYTTDGSEPAIGTGTRYDGPFTLTQACTVRAVAQGQGYEPSLVADTLIRMYNQAERPVISVSQADDAATITLSCATEGTQIWYNMGASADTVQSQKYAGPFVINDHAVLTVFATSPDYVPSELVTKEIFVQNDKVYIDIASHFDASAVYGGTNGKGMFSWGTGAVSQADTSAEPIGTKTDDDGIESPVYPDRKPETFPADLTGVEWFLASQGQSMVWQNIAPGKSVGDPNGYNPLSAADLDTLCTKNDVQFYKFVSGEYNARIQSTRTFRGPFDLVAFLGNANSTGNVQRMGFETSTDGQTWTLTGDTVVVAQPQRLWKKVTVGYRGTDEVYVRLRQLSGNSGCQVYDIYVMANGEKSKQREAELREAYLTGIDVLPTPDTRATVRAVYNLNGVRLPALQRGINIVRMSDGTTRKVVKR